MARPIDLGVDRSGEGDAAVRGRDRDVPRRELVVERELGLDPGRDRGIGGGVGDLLAGDPHLAPHDLAGLGEIVLDRLGVELEGVESSAPACPSTPLPCPSPSRWRARSCPRIGPGRAPRRAGSDRGTPRCTPPRRQSRRGKRRTSLWSPPDPAASVPSCGPETEQQRPGAQSRYETEGKRAASGDILERGAPATHSVSCLPLALRRPTHAQENPVSFPLQFLEDGDPPRPASAIQAIEEAGARAAPSARASSSSPSPSAPAAWACRSRRRSPPTTSTPSRPRTSRPSPATSGWRGGSAASSAGTRWRWWSRANRTYPGIGGHLSTYASSAVALRGRVQPLLPRQGRRRLRRPDLLPGPRRARHLRPRLSRGSADGGAPRALPPRGRAGRASRPTRTPG